MKQLTIIYLFMSFLLFFWGCKEDGATNDCDAGMKQNDRTCKGNVLWQCWAGIDPGFAGEPPYDVWMEVVLDCSEGSAECIDNKCVTYLLKCPTDEDSVCIRDGFLYDCLNVDYSLYSEFNKYIDYSEMEQFPECVSTK